jgi:hypothetical protein
MNFKTHNDTYINVDGTHLQGQMHFKYSTIVAMFGEPMKEGYDDYKSDAEWNIFFDDCTRATIYNYKNGQNYLGLDAPSVEDITDWNIGGVNGDAVKRIKEVFDGLKEIA